MPERMTTEALASTIVDEIAKATHTVWTSGELRVCCAKVRGILRAQRPDERDGTASDPCIHDSTKAECQWCNEEATNGQ